MDEKTEELRDIFMDVSDEETLTERQEETRGSLADDEAIDERIEDTVAEMRSDLEFDTDLTDEELRRVVRGFYAGESDADLADELDASRHAIHVARTDLHLLRETDTDAPFDFEMLEPVVEGEETTADAADRLDVAASTVRRYRRVLAARTRSQDLAHRYTDAFEEILVDVEVSGRLTEDVKRTGLEGAIEGQETNTQL